MRTNVSFSACPQFVSGAASLWNMYEPPNTVINIGEPTNAGAIAWSTAEDCLSLGIWTPSYANATSKLPVAVYVTGGGGVTGGINIASQLPTNWVSRSQEHIVVTMNYRVGILGSKEFAACFWQRLIFKTDPKSRAVDETSLTLLDVRAAVEWVSENIELFGGDKDNIMVSSDIPNTMESSTQITHVQALGSIPRRRPDASIHAGMGRRPACQQVRNDIPTTRHSS